MYARLLWICRVLAVGFAALLLPVAIFAQSTPTTLVLTNSPTPSVFGQAVTLTAAVSPSGATGHVTFYDGVTVLGAAPLAGGQASLITIMLSSSGHALRA